MWVLPWRSCASTCYGSIIHRRIEVFNNYSKPGRGVQKRDPNQYTVKIFFEILQEKLWDISKANLLYIIVSLPLLLIIMLAMGMFSKGVIDNIVSLNGENFTEQTALYDLLIRVILALIFITYFGAGPTTAGSTYLTREFAHERPCWWISDFFGRTRKNSKQSFLLLFLDLVIVFSSLIALIFYSQTQLAFISILYLCFLFFYAMMHIYTYHIMITFELPLKSIMKNAFILVIHNVKRTVILFAILTSLNVLPFYIAIMGGSGLLLMVWLLLEVFLIPVLLQFTTNFFICPVIEGCIAFSKEQLGEIENAENYEVENNS